MNKKLEHILCIDDEPDIVDIIQMCLETVGGFKVSSCSSGIKAIEKVEEINPDLILLDVMMPEMDGPTTLKKLREKSLLSSVPIVFMTARVQPVEIQEYLKIGANAVIAKPFDPMTISSQIADIWKNINV